MVVVAVRKKRPWSKCRRWLLTDARLRDRQRACGEVACQRRARRCRSSMACRESRLRSRSSLASDAGSREGAAGIGAAGSQRAGTGAGSAWDVVQDEMKVEGR